MCLSKPVKKRSFSQRRNFSETNIVLLCFLILIESACFFDESAFLNPEDGQQDPTLTIYTVKVTPPVLTVRIPIPGQPLTTLPETPTLDIELSCAFKSAANEVCTLETPLLWSLARLPFGMGASLVSVSDPKATVAFSFSPAGREYIFETARTGTLPGGTTIPLHFIPRPLRGNSTVRGNSARLEVVFTNQGEDVPGPGAVPNEEDCSLVTFPGFTLYFSTIETGSSEVRNLLILNRGRRSFLLDELRIASGGESESFSLGIPTPPFRLSPGRIVSIPVTFKPVETDENETAVHWGGACDEQTLRKGFLFLHGHGS